MPQPLTRLAIVNRGEPAMRAALERAYQGRQTDFVIEHGGRRLKSAREGFAAAVRRAGLGPGITPHTIRHSVITWLDEASIETRRTAQLAGHRDERTTKRVYTHSSPEVLKEAVGRLNDALHDLDALPFSGDLAQGGLEPAKTVSEVSQKDKTEVGAGQNSDDAGAI